MFKSQTLIQRLGYLGDLLQLPWEPSLRDWLKEGISKSTPYLSRTARWGQGDVYDPTWRIVDNIPRHELCADISSV